MQTPVPESPQEKVSGIKDVVGEIMLKLGPSSRSMIRCSAVGKAWLAAKRDPFFARSYAETRTPACLGFLVGFQQVNNRALKVLRLVYPLPSSGEETAVAMRPWVEPNLLGSDNVVCSRDGVVLTAGRGFQQDMDFYFTSCPGKVPRVYAAVAPEVPWLQKHPKNTFGQFAVVRAAGPCGQSFFIKDVDDFPVCTYQGVTFCSSADVYIHVCEFKNGMWARHVSPPFQTMTVALFHRNPYSVLHGDRLFLMYLVGYIVSFDIGSSTFSRIALPPSVSSRVRSWYDYTVCHHSKGGVAVVHLWHGKLDTWVLLSSNEGEAATWMQESSVDLLDAFRPRLSLGIWSRIFSREVFPLGSDEFFTIQVRSASPNARFVLLTLGFDPNLHLVDMMNSQVHEIRKADTDGMLGQIFALSEPWPV